jgi:hypothetical protein
VFYCNAERRLATRVEFGNDERNKHVLKGSESFSGDGVVQDITDLCGFMEDCLTKWLEHISSMRRESYYLNYFTTEQLVILQNGLANVNSLEKRVPCKVYPLLSGIRKNCTIKDLEKAMHAAFQELACRTKSLALKNAAELPDAMEITPDNEAIERSQEFEDCLQSVIDSGYPEKLAELVIKAVGTKREEGIACSLFC